MKNNLEQTPDEFFDWVTTHSFDQLSATQKQIVLQFTSQDEYEEMHRTINSIQRVEVQGLDKGKDPRKDSLMNQYDKIYDVDKKGLSKWVWFRHAAAVLLLFFSGWMTHRMMQQPIGLPSMATVIRDTLYLAKDTAPVKIFDTIYLTSKDRPSIMASRSKALSNKPKKESFVKPTTLEEVNPLAFSDLSSIEPLHVIKPKERYRKQNLQKGNSIQDDTLMDKYSFTTF